MTMTRAAAILHLDKQFDVIDAAVGTDIDAYSSDVDQALRRMGVAESSLATATVADDNRNAFLALSEYYALRRFARKLALKISMSVNGLGQASEGQMYEHVKELMEEARDQAAGYGYPVDASPTWAVDSINLDFIEPRATSA